jgi:hypothetical protein
METESNNYRVREMKVETRGRIFSDSGLVFVIGSQHAGGDDDQGGEDDGGKDEQDAEPGG